jgi:exoribonuclease R
MLNSIRRFGCKFCEFRASEFGLLRTHIKNEHRLSYNNIQSKLQENYPQTDIDYKETESIKPIVTNKNYEEDTLLSEIEY